MITQRCGKVQLNSCLPLLRGSPLPFRAMLLDSSLHPVSGARFPEQATYCHSFATRVPELSFSTTFFPF